MAGRHGRRSRQAVCSVCSVAGSREQNRTARRRSNRSEGGQIKKFKISVFAGQGLFLALFSVNPSCNLFLVLLLLLGAVRQIGGPK